MDAQMISPKDPDPDGSPEKGRWQEPRECHEAGLWTCALRPELRDEAARLCLLTHVFAKTREGVEALQQHQDAFYRQKIARLHRPADTPDP